MKQLIFLLLLLPALALFGQHPPKKVSNEVTSTDMSILTSDGAWCWFADPRAVYYTGAKEQTYFCWVTTGGDIVVASHNHATGEYLQRTILEKYQPDDHANPSLLIRNDGRIILFCAKHFGDQISRFISVNPEDITSWSVEYKFAQTVTYPYPFQVGDDIYCFFRGGSSWHPYLTVSTDNGATFGTMKEFIVGGGQRPYTRYFQGNDGSIHVAVTTGHPRNEAANKIHYCRFKDNKFYRANGTLIKNYATQGAVNINELEAVYDASGGKGWIWDITLDPQTGYPVMLYAAFPSDTDHRYRYAYWNGASWFNTEITQGGRWFPQTPAGSSEPEPNYSGGLIFDSDNPSVIYLSKPVNDVFEIFKYTTPDHGLTWSSEAVTQNTPQGILNVRPVVPRHHKPGSFDVIWMRGTYVYYADQKYHTALAYRNGAVTAQIDDIVLNDETMNLLIGDNHQLSPVFYPFLAPGVQIDKTLVWKSSNESVASVDNGLVTALSAGSALITATSVNGKIAYCEINVAEPRYLSEVFFDFGTPASPVATGAVGVNENTLLKDSYGWMGTVMSRDRGNAQNDEERDFNMAGGVTVFRVYVPNGNYHIVINQGDALYMHDNMTVKINGVTKLHGITANKGGMLSNEMDVVVDDNKLDFEFSRNGSDPNWIVNSIKITQNPASDYAAYLFAYFTGNSGNQEAIRFALSSDGLNYKALNNNEPVIASDTISHFKAVRDPHIVRGVDGNTYYMVVTDMKSANGWSSNHGIVLLKSTDLVNWTHSQVDIASRFPGFSNVTRAWAPQTIYDFTSQKYMVYFSLNSPTLGRDIIHYSYANADFTDLETTPQVLFEHPTSTIDGDIVYKDGEYNLFFKTEGSGNGIKKAVSTSVKGPYAVKENKYLQQTSEAVEGSCVFKLINSDFYILMYDLYTSGRYQFTQSSDLSNFSVVTGSMNFAPRHGTVIPVRADELHRLREKWDNTYVSSTIENTEMSGKALCTEYYNLQGIKIDCPARNSIYIEKNIFTGGHAKARLNIDRF